MRSHHPAHFNLCPFRPRVWRVHKERVPGGRGPNEVAAKCNRNTPTQFDVSSLGPTLLAIIK
jgi:hypothetical protein